MDSHVQPDPDHAALLTIDVQNDFTFPDGPGTVPGTAEAVPKIREVVEAFRQANRPIIHVVRLYKPDGSNVDLCRRQTIEDGASIVEPGTDGAELVSALTPTAGTSIDPGRLLAGEFQAIGPREWVMYKPRWSAFYRTGLESHLDSQGVNTLVVCGCNFPNCPRTTLYDASARDYRLGFVPEATSGTYDRGIAELEAVSVAVMNVAETADWLR